MKFSRNISAAVLSTFLSILILPAIAAAQAQDGVALQRGYRTGYSDGFMAGYKDIVDSLAKDYSRHAEYSKADRAYANDYGSIADYRDGYQQGFEVGYDTGFEKRSFEANIPADLARRGVISVTAPQPTTDQSTTPVESTNISIAQTSNNAIIIIPRDTEIIVELQDDLNTQETKEGSPFKAKVTAPSEIAGAIIEGRVAKITKPGRIKKPSELSLSFDRIVLSDSRWSNFSGVLTEVYAVKGDNVKRVDVEGTAIGQNSYKQNAIKIGAPAGAGMIIGAFAGGPVGAAVGAGVGAAFGVGAVVVKRGKHIRLNRNQQLRIKTAYETQIR
ncbi:MAG: hypothetical protein IPL32_03235 [Chloracidobacterium sp.]|nr:hypothetical protein [Chloracidobacterium sp.]